MADEGVTRTELDRALRFLNNAITHMRDELLQLGAQVVTLTRKLEDKGAVRQEEVLAELPAAVAEVRLNDESSPPLRVDLRETLADKHAVESPPIPCAELLPLCKARCCTLTFTLSTQDLEDRQVRWDLARPYWNLRRPDGYCVHHESAGGGCSIYQHRPVPCRTFDCRRDRRIWTDFDQRIPAPPQDDDVLILAPRPSEDEVAENARARRNAMQVEDAALRFKRT